MSRSRSRRAGAVLAGALALGLALSACAPVQESTTEIPIAPYTPQAPLGSLPGDTVAELREAVEHGIEAAGATGAIVGVWAPWAGQWISGVGSQQPGAVRPVTTDLSFRIADVTRLMTCDVLDALERGGIVPKDAIVAEYAPGAPQLGNVTLRDLCNGTSGLGSFEPSVREHWYRLPEREWNPIELASYGLSSQNTDVGTSYRNSDAAYFLLGLALERASGMSMAELIQNLIVSPMGLEATSLPAVAAAPPGDPALPGYFLTPYPGGYICAAPVEITTISSSIGFANSGVVSTIEELGQYVRAAATEALSTGPKTRFDNPLPFSDSAEGWRQVTGGAHLVGPLIGQFGTIPGYATAAFSDPATGFTVAVVLNNSTGGAAVAAYLAWQLAAIVSKSGSNSTFALPFTAEDMQAAIADRAVTCVVPEPEEPEELEESAE